MSRFVSQAVHGWWDGFSFLLSDFWFELSYWFNKIHDCALSFVSPISGNVEKTKSHDRRPWPSPSSQVALPGLHDALQVLRSSPNIEEIEASGEHRRTERGTSQEPVSHLASCMLRCRKLLILLVLPGRTSPAFGAKAGSSFSCFLSLLSWTPDLQGCHELSSGFQAMLHAPGSQGCQTEWVSVCFIAFHLHWIRSSRWSSGRQVVCLAL